MSDAFEAREIIGLARRAVEMFVREKQLLDMPSSLSATLARPAACFVSIKTKQAAGRASVADSEEGISSNCFLGTNNSAARGATAIVSRA